MNKKRPKTISHKEFKKRFSKEQNKRIEEEIKYYYLLTKFRKSRKDKGLTQEEVAKRAGINRTTLSMIESGMRNATVEILMRLSQVVELDLALNRKVDIGTRDSVIYFKNNIITNVENHQYNTYIQNNFQKRFSERSFIW